MSIALMTAAWRLDMPASKKLVLLALCDWANDDGGSLHPSIAAVAARSSMSERNAQRVLRELMADGLLEVIGNANGGKAGMTRRYQLNAQSIYDGCQIVTGDRVSPLRVTNDEKPPVTGDKLTPVRVTNSAETGDTGVTQTVIEPSVKQKQKQQHDNATDEPAAKPGDGRRGSRLPDGWTPSTSVMAWAREEHPEVGIDSALAEFTDYWRAVPGQKGCKLDWDATFRNRIREVAARQARTHHASSRRTGNLCPVERVEQAIRERRDAEARTAGTGFR